MGAAPNAFLSTFRLPPTSELSTRTSSKARMGKSSHFRSDWLKDKGLQGLDPPSGTSYNDFRSEWPKGKFLEGLAPPKGLSYNDCSISSPCTSCGASSTKRVSVASLPDEFAETLCRRLEACLAED